MKTCRSEIFGLNQLSEANYQDKAEADKIFEGLLAESEAAYSFAREVVESTVHSETFCLLAVAMEQMSDTKQWRTKPKLHLQQELLEMGVDNPSLYWCYRDEDFGGTLASLSKSRGGHASPTSIAKRALEKFLAKHKVPMIKRL